ncbi:recombinase family protein [Streptomyces sp. NBC_00344]|uniref:recombinase family protein n=1 Tax=Streptomyces sp. NBC_00344 TaxID=2975720 RepID=UPI002E1FF506
MAKYEAGWGKPQVNGRLRAAVMTRLSRDAEDSTSIATQEDDGRTLARLRNWDVVLVTYDVGVSGSIRPDDRPGFGVILSELHHIDVVIARSIDRFTRQTSHFAGLVETLDTGGTTLVDVQGQVDLTSPYGRFVTTIMVAFAQMERELIQGRILRSRVELRRAGRWLGGAAPYGFRIVPDGAGGKRLEVEPDTAEVLREVVRRVSAGVTLSSEADRLNRTGVLSPQDQRRAARGALPPPAPGYAKWTYSALHTHLRSEVLRGIRVVGKRSDRRAVRDATGAPVRVGPALLTDEEWFSLQRALDAAAVDPRRPRRKATLLLHVAWCPRCDEGMYYNTRVYGERDASIYSCRAAKEPTVRESGICPGVTISAGKLESLVEEWLLTKLGAFQFTERVRVGGSGDRSGAMAELNADIEELAASLVGLRGAAKAAVLTQLNSRQEALEELSAEPVVRDRWEWVPTGRTVAEEWAARDVAERRLLLLSLDVRADVGPSTRRQWEPERVEIDRRIDPELDALEDVTAQEAL